jgi:formate dehydrogenase subunit delta
MNIDLLIKMANQITDFWEGEAGQEVAVKEVATHLRRYWEPRMRAQMITYYHERQGSGLNDVAKAAVGVLAEQAAQAKAAAAEPPAAAADDNRSKNL